MKKSLTIFATIAIGSLVIGTTALADVTITNDSGYGISYELTASPTPANETYTIFLNNLESNDRQFTQKTISANNPQIITGYMMRDGILQISDSGMSKTYFNVNEMELKLFVNHKQLILETPLYNYGGLSIVPVTVTYNPLFTIEKTTTDSLTVGGGKFPQ